MKNKCPNYPRKTDCLLTRVSVPLAAAQFTLLPTGHFSLPVMRVKLVTKRCVHAAMAGRFMGGCAKSVLVACVNPAQCQVSARKQPQICYKNIRYSYYENSDRRPSLGSPRWVVRKTGALSQKKPALNKLTCRAWRPNLEA